jgi:uncharacterized protein (DUF305 family)
MYSTPATGLIAVLFIVLALTLVATFAISAQAPAKKYRVEMQQDTTYNGMRMYTIARNTTNANTNTITGTGMNRGQLIMLMDSTSHGAMMERLNGKTGDEFDREFLTTMIQHHRNGIEMAKRAKSAAKHDEIKKLADEITAKQSKEIEQMRRWHKEWGYGE